MRTPTSAPGRTVGGRYALLSAIGAGGMGTVWRAFDEVLRRDVAVKEVLLPVGLPAAERTLLCERTLREARAAASLNTPSVVTIYDVVEEDNRPWIVMALVDARSLADIVRDRGPLPPAVVAEVGLQILDALDAAHTAGILHRDVKPGNILLATDGRATLTDFGVARSAGDVPLTSTGLLIGSPSYIAPERARGQRPGPASDLWSLGATLYAAVEGRPPFDEGEPLHTMTAIVSDPPAPFRLAGPLEPVLAGLLEKDPDRRWDVDRARTGFRAALAGPAGTRVIRASSAAPAAPASGGTRVLAAAAPPARGRSARRRRRRRAPMVVLLASLVVVAVVAGYLWLPHAGRRAHSPATHSASVFERYHDPAGFTISIPPGWKKEVTASNIVQFRDPGGGRFLRLLVNPTSAPDMQVYFQVADRRTQRSLRGYHLIRIDPARVGTADGADWEFTHTQDGHRHVLVRGLIAGGTAYAFYLSTREDQFDAAKRIAGTVADSFSRTA